MFHRTLQDIQNTGIVDCCQALDWIEHNYTPLPHEHTPRLTGRTPGKRSNQELLNQERIKETINNFKLKSMQ